MRINIRILNSICPATFCILSTMPRRGASPGAFQEPKQKRTREQLARILHAADALFAERGYDGTRLSDIAAAVPCSMSTIYDRFGSKEAMLRYMHRKGTEQAITMIEQIQPAAPGNADLRDVLPGALQIGLTLIRQYRGRRRAVIERIHTDPVLMALELELREALAASGTRFLLSYRHQINHPSPELAAAQAMRLMILLTEDRQTAMPVPGPLKLEDDTFVQETCRMVLGYLRIEQD